MKAIEILKEQLKILNNDFDGVWIHPKRLEDAIAELEALENRSCESCKHWHSGREFCTLFDIYTSIGSCGYYWESNE